MAEKRRGYSLTVLAIAVITVLAYYPAFTGV